MQNNEEDGFAVSFIVPIRLDGTDRLENLQTIAYYLAKHFPSSEKILVECDTNSHVPLNLKKLFSSYIFIESSAPFAKSVAMNTGLIKASRPVVAFYDVDVLVDPEAAFWAIRQIQRKRFPLVLPFNGIFVDVSGSLRQSFIRELDVSSVSTRSVKFLNRQPDCSARIVDGGVFFADRDVMTVEGGYNRHMISYGWEDIEILKRFEKLGYYRVYARQNLVHLNHERGPDSVKNEYTDKNQVEYKRVIAMGRKELQSYVNQDLTILGDRNIEKQQKDVRLRSSKSPYGTTRLVALLSKIISRFRHGFA